MSKDTGQHFRYLEIKEGLEQKKTVIVWKTLTGGNIKRGVQCKETKREETRSLRRVSADFWEQRSARREIEKQSTNRGGKKCHDILSF